MSEEQLLEQVKKDNLKIDQLEKELKEKDLTAYRNTKRKINKLKKQHKL